MSDKTVPEKWALAVIKPYPDAYRLAKFLSGFGDFIKIFGLILAVLTVMAIGSAVRSTLAGLILGATIGAVFFLLGVLIAAQGQILKASLDTAVNSSPFLDNEQRAQIMSLSTASSGDAPADSAREIGVVGGTKLG